MKLITLFLPEPYITSLDDLVRKGKYPCRSEAVRLAIRDLLMKEGSLPKAEISADATENLAVAMRLDKQMEFYKNYAGKSDFKAGLYYKQKEASV